MQTNKQFRLSTIALGALAMLNSGQLMAGAQALNTTGNVVLNVSGSQVDSPVSINYSASGTTISATTFSGTATYATSAGSASTATSATTAGYATSAGSASTATTATNVSGGTGSLTTLSVSSGATINGGLTNTGALDIQGAIYNSSGNYAGAVYINDALTVTGAATTNGITNTGNIGTSTLSSTGAATLNSATITNNATVGGTLGVTGATTLDGAATINNTLVVNSGGGNAELSVGTSTITTVGALSQTGASTFTGATTVVGATNINTTGTAATIIGNSNVATTVNATGGNSNLSLVDGTASLASGASSGFTAYSATKTVGTAPVTLTNGNTASQALVNGASVNNVIKGNTLVDGNMYINGTLVYSSNTSATTTVTGTNTSGGMSVVNAGQAGAATVDANGKITTNTTATQATAALTVTNSLGNTHGIVVQESQTTISGGNNSTSLILNDNGARFSNSATGAPVTVTGVADGQQDFDAVNYRQLKQIAAGVAGISAMANIPQVDQNKTFAVGVGLGSFQSQTALALGVSYRVAPNAVIKASASTTNSDRKNTVYGVGAGLSW